MKGVYIFLVGLLFGCATTAIIINHSFSFGFLDLNIDGKVGITELINNVNVGFRDIKSADRHCVEVFWLKDGMPIAQHCIAN